VIATTHLIALMEVLSSTALAKYSAPVSVIPALHPKLHNIKVSN